MQCRSLYLVLVLLLILLVQIQTSLKVDQAQKLQILLTAGSEFKVEIPSNIDGTKFMKISAFENDNTKVLSSPCLLRTTQTSSFRKNGQLKYIHNNNQNQSGFFWESNIWDTLEVQNEIIAIFEDGKIITITHSIANGTNNQVVQIEKTIRLNFTIAFGRLLQIKNKNASKVIYMSQDGCFLLQMQTQKMIKLQGLEAAYLADAVIIDGRIVVANRNSLKVYQINVEQLKIKLVKQATVYYQQQKSILLTISSIYYDSYSNRLFIIDQYEGIKYLTWNMINSKTQLQASNLIIAQKCQQIIRIEEFLFMSCSNLIIADSTSLQLLQQIKYPFHVNSIMFTQTDGDLVAIGDHQFIVYSVTRHGKQILLKILFKGELTVRNYQHYHYLPRSDSLIFLNSEQIQYGKITTPLSELICAFKFIDGDEKYKQITGTNKGKLSIFHRCPQTKASFFSKLCSTNYYIQIKLYDTRTIKLLIWIVLSVTILILAVFVCCRFLKWRKLKKNVQYQQLHQENTDANKHETPQKSVQMIKIRTQ